MSRDVGRLSAEIPSVRVIASAYLRWSRWHRDDRRLAV
jgi:hypothetical protein